MAYFFLSDRTGGLRLKMRQCAAAYVTAFSISSGT